MSDDDSDAEAQAMAAAMGFSSFGAAPVKKKRKFNPTTDSFVEGDQLEKLDRGGKKGKGSGGNTIPLGKQRVIGQKSEVENTRQNIDEIDLDLEDEETEEAIQEIQVPFDRRLQIRRSVSPRRGENEEDGPAYMDTSEAAPIEIAGDGPAYLDTSLPPPRSLVPSIPRQEDSEAAQMQAKIDSILASIQPPPASSIPAYPPPPGSINHYSPPVQMPINGLPARPAFSPGAGGNFGIERGRGNRNDASSVASHSTQGRARGEHNPLWYVDYYDPNFNENPWASLEKEKGLESVGTWLERPGR